MASTRCAWGGNMSSRFSGKSQLRTARLTDEIEDQQAHQHGGEPEEADLPVCELRDAAEGIAPQLRQKKREHALDDQHQGESHDEGSSHSLAAPCRILEIFEELGIGVEDQDVALVLEAGAIGVQAPVEIVELRILVESPGIDRRGLGVALALDPLRLAIGLGDDDLALAVGLGAYLLAFGETLRPQLRSHALPLRVHAPVHRLAHLLRQLHPFQPHVDDQDAVVGGVAHRAFPDDFHDLVALAGDDVVNGALAELVLKRRLDGLLELGSGRGFVPGGPLVVGSQVLDPPFDERVDQHVLLFRRDEAVRLGRVERQYPLVEVLDVLNERPLEMQPRVVDEVLEFAELKDDGALPLIHGERGQARQNEHNNGEDDGGQVAIAHGRSPRSRPRSASRDLAPDSAAGDGSADWAGREAASPSGDAPDPVICMIRSSGRYSRLLPAFASTRTFDVLARICWTMSRYRRWRVTWGALLYSTRTCLKRDASPSAFAITRPR